MIDIRCPNCNNKVAESPDKNLVIMTICKRCHCRYNYRYGVYTHEAPDDMGKRLKYDKLGRRSYQDRLNLNKK